MVGLYESGQELRLGIVCLGEAGECLCVASGYGIVVVFTINGSFCGGEGGWMDGWMLRAGSMYRTYCSGR